MEGTAIRWH